MEERKSNWVVRTEVGLLTILLAMMVGYRFLKINPVGAIDSPLIVVIVLIVILVLSEAFDSFSVGKLLSISREVQKKEKQVERLEDANAKLLAQLVTISSHQAQSQVHTEVYGDYHAGPQVEQATQEEIQQSQQEELPAEPAAERTYPDLAQVEQFALTKYADQANINLAAIVREAKIVSDFRDVDAISNSPVVFDGYVKGTDKELFIEVKAVTSLGPSWRDHLYVMLSKIHHYRVRKGVDAHLDLVLVRFPDRPLNPSSEERFLNVFQPALSNGLLRLVNVNLTEEEAAPLMRAR